MTQAQQAQFFKQPHAVDVKRHATAGLKTTASAAFAKEANSIVITLHELPEVIRSYPVVISNEESPKLVAIMGVDNKNSFIDADDTWRKGHYVPLYVRKYPFGVAKGADENQLVLCVDEEAENFVAQEAELPFYNGEEPTDMSKQALDLCANYQRQLVITEMFCKAVKDAGLLEEKRVQLTTKDQQAHSLSGFSMINETRWNEFAKEHVADWQAKGFVSPLILVLASQSNWKYLA